MAVCLMVETRIVKKVVRPAGLANPIVQFSVTFLIETADNPGPECKLC
jgi:hypothetical protein